MNLKERYDRIHHRIEQACRKSGRAREQVYLMAVSKSQTVEMMREFEKVSRENVIFGENYVQELKKKAPELDPKSQIHFIGGLQSNKVRDAVRLSHVIESVDSEKLAEAIVKEARKVGKVQEIFLQVNASDDEKKRGFRAVELSKVYNRLSGLPELRISGLMTITEFYEEPSDVRPDFVKLRQLRDAIIPGSFLSMGMSSDFEIAIEEGATHIRVGTALFGERHKL